MRERWIVLVMVFLVIFLSGCEREIGTTTTKTSSPSNTPNPSTPQVPDQPASPPAVCGDSKITGTEECDGSVSATCPQGKIGSVKCTDCKLDYSACIASDCKDSDGGLNYTSKGTVTMNNTKTFTDYCRQKGGPFDGYVMEFYCNSTTLAQQNYECPRGCNNGACY